MNRCPQLIVVMMRVFFEADFKPECEAHNIALRDLAGYKLIEAKNPRDMSESEFNATERGKAWVEFICKTPLPVLEEKWVEGTEL